jgi:hypothetical protein
MSFELLVLIGLSLIGVLVLVGFLIRQKPKRTRRSTFQSRWKEVYGYCAHKETWPTALTRADELLDMALKRRRYKGKNMGERLVAAQKVFTENDSVWAAHKLSVKVREHPKTRLKEADVKRALLSMRQALKDLDVL